MGETVSLSHGCGFSPIGLFCRACVESIALADDAVVTRLLAPGGGDADGWNPIGNNLSERGLQGLVLGLKNDYGNYAKREG